MRSGMKQQLLLQTQHLVKGGLRGGEGVESPGMETCARRALRTGPLPNATALSSDLVETAALLAMILKDAACLQLQSLDVQQIDVYSVLENDTNNPSLGKDPPGKTPKKQATLEESSDTLYENI
ncbi:hypothetical protein WISP_21561 [Willisornis vidua]|uniref:Uncharacterized protein n=1 Tax=Willisornis vidua TaxID=1566151 RepID=A0ABQ9DUH7_9PASS|nr:hypothetical protein WISP_21561 [Willisornis vidua]